eukprot:gene58346-biopygen18669
MAAGLDMCPWDMMQDLDEESKDKLFRTLQAMMLRGYDPVTQTWPDLTHWVRDAWTSPIPKSKFDGTVDRLRGISVTPAPARLLGKMITARITDYVEQMGCLCPLQDGFRRGRCTLDTVSRLQSWLAEGEESHLLSADIRRAFDLCEPRLAVKYLERIGVPPSLCSFLIAQLDGSSTRVWTAYGFTPPLEEDPIPINRGTRQGGVESPLLFILLIDPILHVLRSELAVSFEEGRVPQPEGESVEPQLQVGGSTVVDGKDCHTDIQFRVEGDELWVERMYTGTGDDQACSGDAESVEILTLTLNRLSRKWRPAGPILTLTLNL